MSTDEEDNDGESTTDEDESPSEKCFLALVGHGQCFIEESSAILRLRINMRSFVTPRAKIPVIKTGNDDQKAPDALFTLLVQSIGYHYHKILTLLSNLGLRERDIPPGHHRLKWTNVSLR
jgi:hypothetical protein